MRKIRKFATITIVAAVVGCSSGDMLSLSVAGDDPSFDDIRARLGITVAPGTGTYGFAGLAAVEPGQPCNATSCEPRQFALAVYRACARFPATGRNTGVCGQRITIAEANVCAAQRLLQVIDSPGPSDIWIADGVDPIMGNAGTISVPPQDQESNAEMARISAQFASTAFGVVSDALDLAVTSTCTNTELAANAGTGALLSATSLAEEFARFYEESLDLVATASDRFEQMGAAVSDAAYSRRAGRGNASAAALAPFASRTAAAHALIGGATRDADDMDTGLPAIHWISRQGFFTRPRLSGEAQRALELIREAALNPDLIASPWTASATVIPIDNLVAGGGTVSPVDSLRFRLGHMHNREPLRVATSADTVYGLLGVSRDGFVEAREYLAEEIHAFDRSSLAKLDPEPLPVRPSTTTSHGIILYAATRNPPTQLLPSYWAAVLRFDPTGVYQGDSGTPDYTLAVPPPFEWRPIRSVTLTNTSEYYVAGDTWGVEQGATVPGAPLDRALGALTTAGRAYASVIDEAARRTPEIVAQLCPTFATCPARLRNASTTIASARAAFFPSPTATSRYEGASYLGRARAPNHLNPA